MRESLSWRGRRVQLLRDMETKGGTVFRKGEEALVRTTYLGLSLVTADGREIARVAKHEVALLDDSRSEAG